MGSVAQRREPCNTRVTGKSMISCGRQVPPGWTKIAPQTEKPLGSWACTLVLLLLCTYGQCNIAMRFSYFWCSSFHGKHKLTQMDHFVRRYKQYSDRQKNTGETVRLKGNCTPAWVKKPNQPLLVKVAIPMLFPLLPPLSRLATIMRLIRAGLGWKGWSSCLLVEWLPYPRESVERFGAGFNQEQSFQIPYQRASICTGDFHPRGFLSPPWMGSWQIHPLHQGEVVCFHHFFLHM